MNSLSIARKSLEFTGLFEAELLLELMLRFWGHPCADDRDFRNDLLEKTAEVLRQAVAGGQVMQDVEAENTNFVAAMWYAEWLAADDHTVEFVESRREWLQIIQRTMPSCFCNPEDLSP